MKFWKEHTALRVILIACLFVVGIFLVLYGSGVPLLGQSAAESDGPAWLAVNFGGRLEGLLIMLVGVALLLMALALYNKPFQEPRSGKSKRQRRAS